MTKLDLPRRRCIFLRAEAYIWQCTSVACARVYAVKKLKKSKIAQQLAQSCIPGCRLNGHIRPWVSTKIDDLLDHEAPELWVYVCRSHPAAVPSAVVCTRQRRS